MKAHDQTTDPRRFFHITCQYTDVKGVICTAGSDADFVGRLDSSRIRAVIDALKDYFHTKNLVILFMIELEPSPT